MEERFKDTNVNREELQCENEKNRGRIKGLSKKEEIEEKQEWKDSKVNREGRRLCNFLKKQGWAIINGNMKTDDEEEWTYLRGRGESVIEIHIQRI